MPTQIKYQTWDGGEGWNCPRKLIGYCKESPGEVLQYVMFKYDIYDYKGLYRPIDYTYPNNVMGLCISEFDRNDAIVIKSIKDMDLNIALATSSRTIEDINKSFERCKELCMYDSKVKEEYHDAINEIESIIKIMSE